MKNKKLISVLLIVLCLSLCVGATYAYFTDSVTSRGNKIQAGNLKIDLELLNKETQEWNSIKTSQAPIFNYNLWEPGYTDVKLLKVENEGNLAIKWEARFVYEGTIPALAQAIDVYVKASETEFAYPATRAELDASWENVGNLEYFFNNISTILNGELLARESTYFGIELYMPTTVEDNTLQDQTIGEFDIQIVATQLTYEPDAFGTDYDEGVRFPNGGATTPEETTPEETTPEVTTPEPNPNEPEPTDPDIFTWRLNDDEKSYTVTGLKDGVTVPETLVIPSAYKGLSVTAIGCREGGEYSHTAGAFQYLSITSVTIPNSITIIDWGAFRGCSNLKNVTIPNSITYIAYDAFRDCDNLNYNTYENAYYLGNNSNPYVVLIRAIDTSITSFVIHEKTKVIYEEAFKNCTSLMGDLIISDNITHIGDFAFANCSSLAGAFKLGSSVTVIGTEAFYGCSQLTGELIIPNGVTVIERSAFSSCSKLTGELIIPNGVTTIKERAFQYCSGLTKLTIGNSVTTIDNRAFAYCSNLTGELKIPDSVTTIGNSAFEWCSSLRELTIGNGVTTIGSSAFESCSGLTSIAVAAENTAYYSINNCLIERESNTLILGCKNSIIPDSVTTIGMRAFTYCSGLTSIEIPNSVTTIGMHAFQGCSGLTSIVIPHNVTTIGCQAFDYCSSLTIYCQADTPAANWDPCWNCNDMMCMGEGNCSEYIPVVWGYTGE